MTTASFLFRRGLFAVALASALGAPAFAQSAAELQERIDRLERAIQDMQAEIFRNSGTTYTDGAAVPGGAPLSPNKVADLETSLRNLTGQMEQLQFEVRQIKDRLDRFERDTQYRLLTLENGGKPPEGMAPPSAEPGPLASTAPAPQPLGPSTTITGPAYPVSPPVAGTPVPTAPTDLAGTVPPSGTLGTITGPAPGTPVERLYSDGMDQLSRAQYPQAQATFQQILADAPASEYAPQAQFWIADISFVQKDYTNAARGYATMLKQYPDHARAADAMLKLGLSLIQLGQTSEGCTTLGAIRAKYPNAGDTILGRAARESQKAGCR